MNRSEIITLVSLAAGRTDLTRAERHFLHDLCDREHINALSHDIRLPSIEGGLRDMALRLAADTPSFFGPKRLDTFQREELNRALDVVAEAISAAMGKPLEEKAAMGTELNSRLKLLEQEATASRQHALAEGLSTVGFDEVLSEIKAGRRKIYVDLLEMNPANLP